MVSAESWTIAVMAPGWTDYRERVLYQTYDVTELVKSGSQCH